MKKPRNIPEEPKKGCFEFDRFYPQLRIAFEFDGEQHYNPEVFFHLNRQRCQYDFDYYQMLDRRKDEACRQLGITLIRIRQKDLTLPTIKAMIEERLVKSGAIPSPPC